MPMDRIPIVATAADFPSAISAISDDNASGRWYLMRRSIQLGCEDQVPEEWLDGLTAAYNGDRKEAADKGIALPDGSFPIPNRNYLERAIQAYGRASDKPRAKAHIIKRARALNAMSLIPDGWKGGDSAMAASAFAPDEVFYEFLYDDAVSGAVLSIDDWATGYSDMRHVVSDIETCAVMASAYGQDLDWEQQIGEYLDATVAGGNIDEDDYQTVLEALVAAVRHVRTEEGSRFYGEPIGAVIVKDTYIPHGSKMVGDLKSGDFFRFGNKNVQVQASGPGPNGTTRVSVRDTADFDAPPTSWDLISGKPVQTLQRIRADAKASLGADTPKRSLKDRLTGKGKNVEDPTAKIISGTDAKLGLPDTTAQPHGGSTDLSHKDRVKEASELSAKAHEASRAAHAGQGDNPGLHADAANAHVHAMNANLRAGNHNIASAHQSNAKAHNESASEHDALVRHPIVPETGPSQQELDSAAAHTATQTAHINSLSGQSDAKTSSEHAAASKEHTKVRQVAAAEAHRVSSASYQSSQIAANSGTAADHEKAADLHRLSGAMHGEMNGEDHKGIAAAHKVREADHREQADKAIKAKSSEHKVVLTGNQSINLTTGKVTDPDEATNKVPTFQEENAKKAASAKALEDAGAIYSSSDDMYHVPKDAGNRLAGHSFSNPYGAHGSVVHYPPGTSAWSQSQKTRHSDGATAVEAAKSHSAADASSRSLKRGETVSLNQTVKEQADAKAAASRPSDKALKDMSREELRAEVNKFEPGTPARRAVVEEQMRRANERGAATPPAAAEEFPISDADAAYKDAKNTVLSPTVDPNSRSFKEAQRVIKAHETKNKPAPSNGSVVSTSAYKRMDDKQLAEELKLARRAEKNGEPGTDEEIKNILAEQATRKSAAAAAPKLDSNAESKKHQATFAAAPTGSTTVSQGSTFTKQADGSWTTPDHVGHKYSNRDMAPSPAMIDTGDGKPSEIKPPKGDGKLEAAQKAVQDRTPAENAAFVEAHKPKQPPKDFVSGKHTKLGEVRKDATRGDEHHTIPKESLGDGHVPSVGDGVKTSDGKEGTIKRTYQLYSEVEFKDGSKKVVRNSKLNTTGEVKVAQTTKNGRARAVASGNAMPDGSFPVEDKVALQKAIKAVGRAKDPEAVRKHIIAMAKKLGYPELIPAGWTKAGGGIS